MPTWSRREVVGWFNDLCEQGKDLNLARLYAARFEEHPSDYHGVVIADEMGPGKSLLAGEV